MQEHERITDPDVDRLFSETVQALDEADGELVQPVVVIDDLIAVPVEVQPDGLWNHVCVINEFVDSRRVLNFSYQGHQVYVLANHGLPDAVSRLRPGEALAVKLKRGFKPEAVGEHLAELAAC